MRDFCKITVGNFKEPQVIKAGTFCGEENKYSFGFKPIK